MPNIEDIRINGQLSILSTPVAVGLPVSIGWDFIEDPSSYAQSSYELRVGTSNTALGTDEFNGNRADVEELFTGNFYEHKQNNLSRGDTYYGQIRVTDPDGDASIWTTFSFLVNRLPFVSNTFLLPSSPNTHDDIELSYTYHDLDNHEEANTKIRWFKNNIPVPEYNDLCILPNQATEAGQSWTAKITPSDGLEFGPTSETSAVTVTSSSVFAFNIKILPLDANVDDILKVDFDIAENEYITNVASIIEWYINGVAVEDSNNQFIRLDLQPGDLVKAVIKLTDGNEILNEFHPQEITIQDVPWNIFDVTVDELVDVMSLNNLTPSVEWNVYKSTADTNELPSYLRLYITKTPSHDGKIWDTGFIEYTKNTYTIPSGILQRGQTYYLHIGVSDETELDDSMYAFIPIDTAGSSWSDNVDNSQGWTIEFKVSVKENGTNAPDPAEGEDPILPQMGVYIHDGSYFCALILEQKHITLVSGESTTYTIPTSEPDLTTSKTFKVSGKNTNIKVYMNNMLIIDGVGLLSNTSLLKQIEYGDLDNKYTNEGTFRFFRYSTDGAFGFSNSLAEENVFYFHSVGQLKGGQIQYILDNLVSVLPDDTEKSAKLVQFNENSKDVQLSTVTKNYSPITSIYIDKNRNKYIGTANGVTAIYGEKHDPDYQFLTSSNDVEISPSDFDRITTVSSEQIDLVEPDNNIGWFTIDTTYRTIGVTDAANPFGSGDPYDPYRYPVQSHAIHYYSQRTHGHAWYDRVDNEKGWQITFSFQLERLEQDDFQNDQIRHAGFGVYINDGTKQEIIHFYEDRITLFYANAYVNVSTRIARDYRIVGKDNNLLIYQKINSAPTGGYQLLLNGNGLFTTAATVAGNSQKPKLVFDQFGIYHSVWHDDGNQRSQILYASFDGSSWSTPELVSTSTQFSMKNPSIAVDSSGKVWTVYEDTSWGKTEISVSTRDSHGWNKKIRITNYASNKRKPTITIDALNNVYIAWEDDRNGPWQIFSAKRRSDRQAWMSSGHFGTDTVVMQQSGNDEEYTGGAVQLSNPQLAYMHPKVWLVAQALVEDTQYSVIYRGFYDVNEDYWNSMGSIITDSNGEFAGTGTSFISSQEGRNSVNPSIAVNSSEQTLAIVWEDKTDDVYQIWGSSYDNSGTELSQPIQITNQSPSCRNPSIGFTNRQAIIVYEVDNQIYSSSYNTITTSFNGSATGGTDTLIETNTNKVASSPSVAPFVPSSGTKVVYNYFSTRDGTLQSLEVPDYLLIGCTSVALQETNEAGTLTSTSTSSDALISNLDTKEFAFGDISENIGVLAHWKDIKMYFGYDARPPSITKFNQSNVSNWPDNRINDIFVDVFGNLITATYGGLCYHNVFTGQLVNIEGHTDDQECSGSNCILQGKLVTAVKWGKNGAWFVGTTDGIYLTTSAGKRWSKFDTPQIIIYSIDIDKSGRAVCGTSDGIYVVKPNTAEPIVKVSILNVLPSSENKVKVVAVDENDIVWAGTDFGLLRVENLTNFILFNRKNGMSTSYVTSITIVNKYLRYVGTPSGINKMNGTKFSKLNTQTHDLLNGNVSSLQWCQETNSLWAGILYSLHEIVFRDPAHEIISDEIVQYDNSEISTEIDYDKRTYFVLDVEEIQADLQNPLVFSSESSTVLINKNPIDFGYTVDQYGGSVQFACDLLTNDEVEVKISNRFIQFHDFTQTNIEQRVLGTKRTNIKKLVKTFSKNQLLALAELDKHQILLYTGESSLPYTTLMLDRDLPVGCLQKIDTLTSTTLKFRILAYDNLSGLDGYILSNYENFTSDGDLPLSFNQLPTDGIVTHDLAGGFNRVTTSFTFPSSVVGLGQTFNVGNGAALGTWTDTTTNIIYLFAGTNNPPVVWKYDPATEEWTGLQVLDDDNDRVITQMFTFNNVLYVATGTDASGDKGVLYKTTDGNIFTVAALSIDGTHINAIAGALDGTIYFGDNVGDVYEYRNNTANRIYTDVGQEIHSMDIWKDYLIVGTGNTGKVYLINIDTDSNIIIFDGNETHISKVHVKDALFSESPEMTNVYIGSGEFTNIYRANLSTFDFIKSYSSFGKTINKITTVDRRILQETLSATDEITQTIAAMGNSIYKHKKPTWDFFYQHDEEIKDVIQYGVGTQGLFIISNSKISKWTQQLVNKTVYLRLKDKAGNYSSTPITDPYCPAEDALEDQFCCNYAYSVNIKDLTGFLSESRVTALDEYGVPLWVHNSATGSSFYSADIIDTEVGYYNGEALNGSNNLISWISITWTGNTPETTSIQFQIRSGKTETQLEEAEWSNYLVFDNASTASLEHITDQWIQFRAILTSRTRDISPSLSSVILRNLTTQAAFFFSTNFVVPSRPIKGLLTANYTQPFTPVSTELVIFGVCTTNSVNFNDYTIISPNRLFNLPESQNGNNLRVGVKLLSPRPTEDPYSPYSVYGDVSRLYNLGLLVEFEDGSHVQLVNLV